MAVGEEQGSRRGRGQPWTRRAPDPGPEAGESLHDRKKRLTRQQISNTATEMFLRRGFDQVRVAEVAAACGVSEKTVFNYFPTKESLLFDREEDMAFKIREALSRRDSPLSPITAAVAVATSELDDISEFLGDGPGDGSIRSFSDLVESSPSLRAAQLAMMERLEQVAAEAMAERAGVDPESPEPQIAAAAIVALWRIQWQALRRYSDGTRSSAELCEAVLADVNRAARLIDTGLWSFSMAVQGTSSRQQLKEAAVAANEARKQVVAALKQARDAWRQAVEEHGQHVGGGDLPLDPKAVRQLMKDRHKAFHEQHKELQQQQKELQQQQKEIRQQQKELRQRRPDPSQPLEERTPDA